MSIIRVQYLHVCVNIYGTYFKDKMIFFSLYRVKDKMRSSSRSRSRSYSRSRSRSRSLSRSPRRRYRFFCVCQKIQKWRHIQRHRYNSLPVKANTNIDITSVVDPDKGRIQQCGRSGMFIPNPTFFHPGSELSPSRIPDHH